MIDRIKVKAEARQIVQENLGTIWQALIIIVIAAFVVTLGGNLLHLLFYPAVSLDIPVATDSIMSILIFLVETFLSIGLLNYLLKLVRGMNPTLNDLFNVKSIYLTAIVASILIGIYTFLWSLLLIIPGIIAAISYSMTFYILVDNPEMGFSEAISASKKMMNGHKMEFFIFQLSFIGWGILCALTCGILYIWVGPYILAATTLYYEKLRDGNKETKKEDPIIVEETKEETDEPVETTKKEVEKEHIETTKTEIIETPSKKTETEAKPKPTPKKTSAKTTTSTAKKKTTTKKKTNTTKPKSTTKKATTSKSTTKKADK